MIIKKPCDTHYQYLVNDEVVSQLKVLTNSKDSVWVWDVITFEPFRRQGYMKLLIQEVINDFPKTNLYLQVYSDNEAAINLYKSFGFEYNNKSELKQGSEVSLDTYAREIIRE